jgi:hypothetical protein
MMTTIAIIAHPKPEAGWVHRFRNFGEEVYVRLRATCDVNIAEIDAAFDEFHVRAIGDDDAVAVRETVTALVHAHNLSDAVFVREEDTVHVHSTVVLVLDTDLGERLWEVVCGHPTWVVGSEPNRTAVEEMRTNTAPGERPDVTLWSNEFQLVTEENWCGVLDTLETHHGELSSETPLSRLNVYGAKVTPAAAAALRQYDFVSWMTAPSGFVALKL